MPGWRPVFYYIGKFSELSYVIKKPSGQERTAADWNDVAEATRRRRRIPRAGFFLGTPGVAHFRFAGVRVKKIVQLDMKRYTGECKESGCSEDRRENHHDTAQNGTTFR